MQETKSLDSESLIEAASFAPLMVERTLFLGRPYSIRLLAGASGETKNYC
jgi:hypothetical protein